MAEKQVAHVMALDRLMKCFCLLELDQIHEAVPDVERRMVHEEENRSLGAVQLSGEPVAPLVTINPSRTRSSLECVEKQTHDPADRENALHEPVAVAILLAEAVFECLAFIVVADQQECPQWKALDPRFQRCIGFRRRHVA
jgi:hypothetical protein